MNILESIYTKIKETAALTAILGTGDNCRAYPLRAMQDCARPYLVFETIPGYVPHAMNTDSGSEQIRALFRCYDEDLSDSYALALAVITALQDFSGTLGTGGVSVARIFRSGDVISEFDPDASSEGLFMSMVDMEIWFTR